MATRLLERYKWTKDGRKWVFYIWRPTLSGKKKKYTSPAFHTKKEALEAEREFMCSLQPYRDESIVTFKDLYTAFYKYQEDKVKITTLKTYNDRIKYMKLLDNIKLKDLNAQHYELWRCEVNKTGISTIYKNDIQKFIKIVLNFGTKMYDFNFIKFYNKITKFNNYTEIKKDMDFYTEEEFKKFISCENNIKYKCLYQTLYYCGLRRGEARGLTWNNIDFINKELHLVQQPISDGESSRKYILTTLKTKSSVRTIPILDKLFDDFKILYESDKSYYGFNNDWFVFGNYDPITNYAIRSRKNYLCKKAGLRQIRTHDFRHSCASMLINEGANITLVAYYLGHTKISETLNTYSHMYKNELTNLVNIMNKKA